MLKSLSKKIIFIGAMSLVLVSGISAQDHPWRAVEGWAEMTGDREWGATSAVYPGKNGTMWVGERCGKNSCVDSKDDPVLQFDRDGNLVLTIIFGLQMLLALDAVKLIEIKVH